MKPALAETRPISWRSVLALCAFSSPTFALGGVLVVDPSGAGDHTTIQAAVDAAVEGDTLLVRTGLYPSFSVTSKSLAIVGDTSAVVDIDGAIRIRNITADQTLVVANLRAVGTSTLALNDKQFGLRVKNSPGHVRIQNCDLTGARGVPGSIHEDSWEAVLSQTTDRVVFTACRLSGGDGNPQANAGARAGNGIHAFQSGVRVYDSPVLGGLGAGLQENRGGTAYRSFDSFLFASNARFQGGPGLNGGCPCGLGGDGGDGIEAYSPARSLLFASTVQEGTGGSSCDTPSCPALPPGDPGVAFAGTGIHADLGDLARSMTLAALVREHTTVRIDFAGEPGDRAFLIVSDHADSVYLPRRGGILQVDLSGRHGISGFGAIPAGGTLTGALPIGDLAPGEESKVFHLQALLVDAQGRIFLATPASLVVIDQAF